MPSFKTAVRSGIVKYTSGLLGAFLITSVTLSMQRISVANMLALIVDQLLIALRYDNFVLMGVRQSPVTLTRLAGVASLFLGTATLLTRLAPAHTAQVLILFCVFKT